MVARKVAHTLTAGGEGAPPTDLYSSGAKLVPQQRWCSTRKSLSCGSERAWIQWLQVWIWHPRAVASIMTYTPAAVAHGTGPAPPMMTA